jgi:hypothetical protein
MPRRRRGRLLIIAAIGLLVVVACGPSDPSETGIVISIDSPGLGRVDSFELLTPDGRTLSFDSSETQFRSEFPISHLSEHQLLSDPIEVTYREDGERLVVIKLDDGG